LLLADHSFPFRRVADKHYNFHLGAGGAATAVSMSSTPGWLSSIDDFYINGQDLVVIETTNGLNNP